jgi:alginate O-acetyltransferase complex protein AlgJ
LKERRYSYRRTAEIILLGLTSLVFAIPGLLTICLKIEPNAFLGAPWLRNATLAGVVPPPAPPPFSLKNIRDGEWQKGVARQFDENFPGREFITRITHEAYLRLLRTTGINSRPWDITLGLKKNLFVNTYLIEYCTERKPAESLRPLVQHLRTFKEALQRKQIPFVFLLTPSKPAIIPEAIPPRWLARYDPRPRSIDNFRPMLQEAGIDYVDGIAMTAALKDNATVPVFPTGGIHWGFPVAWQVGNAVLTKFKEQGMNVQTMDDPAFEISYNPQTEADIVKILDLVKPWHFPVMSVEPRRLNVPEIDRPNCVVIGGSFNFGIDALMSISAQFAEIDVYFYYNVNKVFQRDGETTVLPIRAMNFARDIFAADCLILEINESLLNNADALNAFLNDALEHLPELDQPRQSFAAEAYADVQFDEPISFEAAKPNLIKSAAVSGFSVIEPLGRWSDGDQASVRLTLPPADSDIKVTATARPFLRPGVGQAVRVYANDHLVAEWSMKESKYVTREFRVPAKFIRRQRLVLRFDIMYPTSHAELKQSDDVRKLGIFLAQIIVEGVAEN